MVSPNDPILVKIAEEVSVREITSEKTQEIIEKLLNLAYGEQTDRKKPVLVGLAAPQAGISKRIILVDIGADGHGGVSDLRVFINPRILSVSDTTSEWYEGCYSTDHVCGVVTRPISITLQAYDKQGKVIEREFKNYTARIFQHEIDHLNGKVFIDHITNDNNLHWVEDDEFPKYRDREAWRTWPRKCSRETWNKIKGIRG